MPNIEQIISIVIGLLFTVVPAVAVISKKVGAVSKETGELFTAVFKALEDGKISGDEVRGIIKEAKDVQVAVSTLRSKSVE